MNPDARAAYDAALTAIERRKAVRGLGLRTWKWDAEVEQTARAAAQQMAAAGWKAELSQLAAHASADVLAALRAADAADNQARVRFAAWSALADQNRLANEHAAAGLPAHFASTEATMGAFFAIAPAVVAADQADDALATLIKAHLGPSGKGGALRRRPPLRTVLAGFLAHGSSKPLGQGGLQLRS